MKDFYIVGIGASAGGLAVLEKFFVHLPADSGMAFVVVQHLSPDHKSRMGDILAKNTPMQVVEAAENMAVAPGRVYLIPADKSMTLVQGHLHLVPREGNLPIDLFFDSLAETWGEKSVGIVLSGTGNDGSRGIRSIKEADGLVMVQRPDSAEFDGMPQSALATGLADWVLLPEEMPGVLLAFLEHQKINAQAFEAEALLGSRGILKKILALLRARSDTDFAQYKPNTVLRRVERRMGILRIATLADYLKYLESSEDETKTLYKELLIGVTRFFRDPGAFEAVQRKILPKLFGSKKTGEAVRVWAAGCSTGEEAYSLAILLAEHQAHTGSEIGIKVFATDIDATAVEFAAAGVYPESITADVSPERLHRFFVKRNDKYEVQPDLRKLVVFAQHDLTKHPPFGKLDLIACRNLFIYLEPDTQDKILRLFHFALRSHGFLFLGSSEGVPEGSKLFECQDKKHKLYAYRPDFSRSYSPPRLGDESGEARLISALHLDTAADKFTRGGSQHFDESLQEILLQEYLPACVVIDERLEVLRISAKATAYLQIPVGRPSYNLAKMLPEGVGTVARIAVYNAMKENHALIYKAQFKAGGGGELNLHIKPLLSRPGNARLFLLQFEESPHPPSGNVTTLAVPEEERLQVLDLERELQYTRETLQAAIEELETANEELQAGNEELLTANEELQSTNEELITLNNEHQKKIIEAAEANEVLDNLLRSTQIGTVFLDPELRIRRFTPAVAREINLIDSDVGRPFSDLTHHLAYPELLSDFHAVLDSHASKDIEVAGKAGSWYLLRLLPYLTHAGEVQGVVLTLIDITQRKQIELALQQARLEAETANRAKDVFLANMSHELRTPLNVILGYAQLFQQDDTISAENQENIAILLRSGEHLLGLIEEVLDFARIEAEHVNLTPDWCDMRDFVANMCAMFKDRTRQKGLAFCCQTETPLPSGIQVDERRLRQILLNLLGNAVKYTEQGCITWKLGYCDGVLQMRVEDTGPGIAPLEQEKIFQPFHRVADTARRAGGAGLGLSIANHLVEKMGGKLWVESAFGQGSCFCLTLPLPALAEGGMFEANHTDADHAPITGYRRTEGNGAYKILIADDEAANRGILVKWLTSLGFETREAVDGEDCLAQAQAWRPDAILMDIVMPNLNGLQAAFRLRDLAEFKDTPIIAVSARAFDNDREASLTAGCQEHLFKPLYLAKLTQTLARYLPLEWVYADVALPPEQHLPPEQTQRLLEMVKRGDVEAIGQALAEFKAATDKETPLLDNLAELLKHFDLKAIQQKLKADS